MCPLERCNQRVARRSLRWIQGQRSTGGPFGAFVVARAQVDLGSTNVRLGIQRIDQQGRCEFCPSLVMVPLFEMGCP
jgi:hypothetical protein